MINLILNIIINILFIITLIYIIYTCYRHNRWLRKNKKIIVDKLEQTFNKCTIHQTSIEKQQDYKNDK